MKVRRKDLEKNMEVLKQAMMQHRFWKNPLFLACKSGNLTVQDFRYIFSQYYLYSKNFSRYIAGLLAACESDYFRSLISENLWDEGGGMEPEKRHAAIFRRFMTDSLEIEDPELVEYDTHTKYFVDQYLNVTRYENPHYIAAFLALGTEGMVSQMYKILMDGLSQAGFSEEELEFFAIHIECDDEHGEVLNDVMLSYSHQEEWLKKSLVAINHALDLRDEFFRNLYLEVETRKVAELLSVVQSKLPKKQVSDSITEYVSLHNEPRESQYVNVDADQNISFEVVNAGLPGTVLDPRVVNIPAGSSNELHRHAHETCIYVIAGKGHFQIGQKTTPVSAGDIILVPRWAIHQMKNTGDEAMKFLGVTDFNLTSCFAGNTEESYRARKSDPHQSTGIISITDHKQTV